MKKIILLSSLLLLSACGSEKEVIEKLHTQCIDGLVFLVYHGGYGTSFQQVYIPAENPANPPQPKTCTTEGVK